MGQENTAALVFLSYSHKNLSIAIRLERDLREKKIPIWRDERNIKPDHVDWDQEIRDAIARSSAVIYLATPDARASRVVRAELALASMYNKPVYLLWREGKAWVDVVPLDNYPNQHIDIREPCYQKGLQQLLPHLQQLIFAAINQPDTINGLGKEPIVPSELPVQKPSPPLMERPMLLARIFRWRRVADTPDTKTEQPPQITQDYSRNPYKGLRAFTVRDASDFLDARNW